MRALETHRNIAWFAAVVSCASLDCGGHLVSTDATGGKGGGAGSSSSGPTGSTVGVGTTGSDVGTSAGGGMVGTGPGTTVGTATSTTVGTGTGTGTGGTGGGCSGIGYCDPSRWPGPDCVPIATPDCSDFDSDQSPLGIHCVMPGGIWSVDVDGMGTPKQDSYRIEPCGTTGNGFHFYGKGHTLWGAEAAATIVSQTQPVDVSAFTGMSFVVRSTTPNNLIFKLQNSYSQPPCGKCDELVPPQVAGTECYSGYIKTIPLAANSTTPIVVAWADLAQQGWGYRPPGSAVFNPYDLISVAFAFDVNVTFDVCIDDVKFVR
jgi:hypothetical protein